MCVLLMTRIYYSRAMLSVLLRVYIYILVRS